MSASRLPAYTYRAQVWRVIDGDTFIADVDLGFGIWIHQQSFRLLGCNAREKNDPGGREAARNLAGLIGNGTMLTLTSVKPDKFGGRYDASVTLPDGTDLVETLIQHQWASAWDGTGTKPLPAWPRTDQTPSADWKATL
jgi:endonuclease YncB( thermonuclease family)